MKKIKLSFCISTFNRAGFIGETLDSIIPQITNEVEIVIVDGASTDRTEQILLGYKSKCPQIRYFKQEQNKGVDRDFNNAVERAQGEYCWLMSDDDLLKPGAVKAVLDSLSAYNYALVLVNAEVRSKDLSRVILSNMIGLPADKIYSQQDSQTLFIETSKYVGYVGAVVIKRELWCQREKERYFGSCFAHVGVVFQKPLIEDVLAIVYPWIVIRYGNGFWTPRGFDIWMFKWPELIWSFSSFSDETKSKITPLKPWGKIRTLMLFRAVGAFTLNEYRRLLEPRIGFGWKRLAARVVAQMPRPLLNFFLISYMNVTHTKSPMWLYDLKRSPYNYFKRFLHN